MPRMNDPSMENGTFGGGRGFHFSGTRIDRLGATEYTLVTIAVDCSGSTAGFAEALRKCLTNAVQGCMKSPRALNLLVRVIRFSTSFPGGIDEIHGFKPLSEIDINAYPQMDSSGGTPLYDVAYSAPGATNAYAEQLMAQDFNVNGIFFVVTDGRESGASIATVKMVADEMKRGQSAEVIESLVGIVVGINARDKNGNDVCQQELDAFASGTGMRYVDAGDATPGRLAKLADFVSQSVSSQAQAAGTGGPSQNISATI